MNIQYIALQSINFESPYFCDTSLSNPKDLDDFDINFIDLNNSKIWPYLYSDTYKFGTTFVKDFNTLGSMISHTKSVVILCLPENQMRDYGIKDYIEKLVNAINIFCPYTFSLTYGRTTSRINTTDIDSDFTFSKFNEGETLTRSIKSDKPTTIAFDNIIITTLDLVDYDHLIEFMKEIKLIKEPKEDIPEWMKEIKMFDDDEQVTTIQTSKNEIAEIEQTIQEAEAKLEDNNRLKSILYTQSEELVEVVFEIIEELLEVDLSEFEDKKIEDIAFNLDGKTFIGEIKGITSNVKTINLSQLDNHYTHFLEKHPEIQEENVYKLLIVNHQRKRSLNDRDPVDQKQIQTAKTKYESLIIETSELLKLLEKYRNQEISRAEIVDMFCECGLLTVN